MKIQYANSFTRDYERLPRAIQDRVDRQVDLLSTSPGHQSLRLKKMEGKDGYWEARVTRGYRITFAWLDDTAVLRRVGSHDILRNP